MITGQRGANSAEVRVPQLAPQISSLFREPSMFVCTYCPSVLSPSRQALFRCAGKAEHRSRTVRQHRNSSWCFGKEPFRNATV